MKLWIPCSECDWPKEGEEIPMNFLHKVEVRDDNVYEFDCQHGHTSRVVVLEEKFEILFEIAINAIIDGYCREAVVSAASSLERFYEFFLQVASHGCKVSSDEFKRIWKEVKNRSELQLGMFIGAHLLRFASVPNLMPERRANFRNSVVHKGHIPTREEAIDYLNSVLGLIVPLWIEMRKSFPASIREVKRARLKGIFSTLGGKPTSKLGILSTIRHAVEFPSSMTIEETLANRVDMRMRWERYS